MRIYRFGHAWSWVYSDRTAKSSLERGGGFSSNLCEALGDSCSEHTHLWVYEDDVLLANADVGDIMQRLHPASSSRYNEPAHYLMFVHADNLTDDKQSHEYLARHLLPRLGLEP